MSGIGLDLAAFVASLLALRALPLFLVQSAVASSVGVVLTIAGSLTLAAHDMTRAPVAVGNQ